MKSLSLKSLVLAVVVLASSAVAARAETAGFHLGLNGANASTSPDLNTDSRVGLVVGAFLELPLYELFFVQPELAYLQKGASSSVVGADSTLKLDYLALPVLLKAKVPDGEWRPFVLAGPNLGFRLNATVDTRIGDAAPTSFTTDAETIDFAFDFGGGTEYWFSEAAAAILDIRYSLGITNVLNQRGLTWRSNGVQFLLGVGLAI